MRPLTLHQWRTASGLFGVDETTRALATTVFDTAQTARDILGGLPESDVLPYVAIAANDIGHPRALQLLTAELDVGIETSALNDPRIKAWAATAPPGDLAILAGRRRTWDAPNRLDNLLLSLSAVSVWLDPSPLLLYPLLRSVPPRPEQARWDDTAQTITAIRPLGREERNPDGSYAYITTFFKAEDIVPDRALGRTYRPGAVPIAETIKRFPPNAAGPPSREAPEHHLFRRDGSSFTWRGSPKVYSHDERIDMASGRRHHHIQWLKGLISASVDSVTVGRDILANLRQPVADFIESGKGDVFMAILTASIEAMKLNPTTAATAMGMEAALPIVRQRLAPWLSGNP